MDRIWLWRCLRVTAAYAICPTVSRRWISDGTELYVKLTTKCKRILLHWSEDHRPAYFSRLAIGIIEACTPEAIDVLLADRTVKDLIYVKNRKKLRSPMRAPPIHTTQLNDRLDESRRSGIQIVYPAYARHTSKVRQTTSLQVHYRRRHPESG